MDRERERDGVEKRKEGEMKGRKTDRLYSVGERLKGISDLNC